jgi:integrase
MEKIDEVTTKLEDVFPKKLNGYVAANGRTYKGWYEKYPVLNCGEVKRWVEAKMNRYARNGKDPADFQVTTYLNPLQKYCDFYDVDDPAELLEETVDERNRRLLHYLGELIRGGSNETTVRNAYQSRIKSFYSARGAPVTDGLETLSSGQNHDEIILDKETLTLIQNKLERAEYRLILKFQALCGLRIGDVLGTLTAGEAGGPRYGLREYEGRWYIPKFKTRKEQVVINYLFLPKELSDLLRATYNEPDLGELDLREILRTRNGTRIDGGDFLARCKEVADELGIEDNLKTHSFRKYFSNQISSVNLTETDNRIGADFENKFKEHLMGHKLSDLSRAYKQKLQSVETAFSLWKELEKAVCIDCEILDETDQRIGTLQDKYDSVIEELNRKDRQLRETREQVRRLSEAVDRQRKLLRDALERLDG